MRLVRFSGFIGIVAKRINNGETMETQPEHRIIRAAHFADQIPTSLFARVQNGLGKGVSHEHVVVLAFDPRNFTARLSHKVRLHDIGLGGRMKGKCFVC